MSTHRDPLGSISLNTNASASSSRRKYIAPKDRPLASIFIQKRRAPTTPSSSSYASASSPPDIKTPGQSSQDVHEQDDSPVRKRARVDAWEDDMEGIEERKREDELTGYFMPTPPTRGSRRVRVEREKEVQVETVVDERAANTWVRSRRRMGVQGFRSTMTIMDRLTPTYITHPPYLTTLTHSLTPFLPEALPSKILLPSLHSPTGRARDLSPALCIQFSNSARRHTASSAKEIGLRRMMAVAGEEGGMRIVDVDAPQGHHRESGGWWWRAHANAIFDTKWSDDDSKIMTTSGDQTTRIHALDSSTPTLLATLRGHTSSVKTATFFDPSRANQGTDASKGSIVASGGRDGNILIFDLRCKGRRLTGGGVEECEARSSARERERYSAGIPGFSPKREGEDFDPVMVINGAHKEVGKRGAATSSIRSVTALIALQTMSGKLASGGSADGVIRLWDLRFPAPSTRFPDPQPVHSSALFLPDPTTYGHSASRRPRGIHSIIESPLAGDIYTLTGDSKIHTIRPSYASPQSATSDPLFHQGILPESYGSDNLTAQSFFIKMALSPDGRYLAAGSGKGGVVAFDTREKGKSVMFGLGDSVGYWPEDRTREVSTVDWGMGIMAACSDDRVTRIWRSNEGEKEDEWGSIGVN